MNGNYPQQLDITLPPFRRLSWASPTARGLWGSRFAEFARVWPDVLLTSARGWPGTAIPVLLGPDVSHTLRAAAARSGLRLTELRIPLPRPLLPWQPPIGTSTRGRSRPFLLGTPDAVMAASRAPADVLGETEACRLAVPACCVDADRHAPGPWADPWWPAAVRTMPAKGGWQLELARGSSRTLLAQALGLPSAWFVPCNLLCEQTTDAISRTRTALQAEPGLPDFSWLAELDQWPVEWSSLHGIAELRTPVFKLMCPAQGATELLTIRIPGVDVIPGSASGVRFPFRAPTAGAGRRRLTVL